MTFFRTFSSFAIYIHIETEIVTDVEITHASFTVCVQVVDGRIAACYHLAFERCHVQSGNYETITAIASKNSSKVTLPFFGQIYVQIRVY